MPALNDTIFPDAYGQPVIYHPLGAYSAVVGESYSAEIQAQAAHANQVRSALAQAIPGPLGQQIGDRIASDAHSRAAESQSLMKLRSRTCSFSARSRNRPARLRACGNPDRPDDGRIASNRLPGPAATGDGCQVDRGTERLDRGVQFVRLASAHAGIGTGPSADRQSWERWLTDLKGYAYVSPSVPVDKPTVVEEVPLSTVPQPSPVTTTIEGPLVAVPRHSCFAAGTMVRTFNGAQPIEELSAGDLVLARDTSTGVLSYLPILVVYHNPPNATFRIDLDRGSIVATGIHRFWKAGQGWVMTRDLKPGDRLRTVSGSLLVRSIQSDKVQKVFNLQVAGADNFFVGVDGVLAHDNSLVSPAQKPFDRVPPLEEIARR